MQQVQICKDVKYNENIKYNEDIKYNEGNNIDTCTICWEKLIENNINTCTICCKEIVHKDCIIKWINDTSTCPFCKDKKVI